MVRRKILDKQSSFTSKLVEAQEDSCIDYLIKKGYMVIPPKNSAEEIKNSNDLIYCFYKTMEVNNKDRLIGHTFDKKTDIRNMSTFIRSRLTIRGIEVKSIRSVPQEVKKSVYKECSDIIRCMFENEGGLALNGPITSTWVLTQKWIIDKVIAILNNEDEDKQARCEAEVLDILNSMSDDEDIQQQVSSELEKIYKDVVLKNGKKEDRRRN